MAEKVSVPKADVGNDPKTAYGMLRRSPGIPGPVPVPVNDRQEGRGLSCG